VSQVVAIVATTVGMCNITTKGDVTMKTKYLTYCALMVLAIFSASASADIAIVGDANNDSVITTADAALVLQMATGSVAADPSADVNYDSVTNSVDAFMVLSMAQQVQVCVNAPDVVSEAFDATIDVCEITDLDSGQFELTFDSSVVNVTAVDTGDIGGTEVPIDSWNFTDAGTIRVLFNLPNATGVSGSGQIATISFEIVGAPGDTSVLNLSNGMLVDVMSNETPALWHDCEVAVGVAVAVNSPEVTIGAFSATVDVEDIAGMNGGQFDLTFDPGVVNVTNVTSGEIGGTAIPIVDWGFMDADTIRVLFKLSGADGVSGTGSLATIDFAMAGSQSDACALDISDGTLSDTEADEIPATWVDAAVAIGVAGAVNSPEVTIGAFSATVDVEDVVEMNGGQFDLSFDASVVNVTNVTAGDIAGTTVPLLNWTFMDPDTIRVLFKLSRADGVSGSGSVATIEFALTGSQSDATVLDISAGNLADVNADEIPATWADAAVAIGVPVTVNAPEVTTDAFTATVDINGVAEMNSGQFDLTFDPSVVNVVNVSAGSIGGTTVPLLNWTFMDPDTIRVLFKLSGADGVSGSGSVATIDFALTGLADVNADEIPATWADASVAIGVTVAVNSPETISGAFSATVDVEDIAGMNGGQFDLTFDPSVVNVTNVTSGEIGGTAIPIVDWGFMDADTVRVLFKLSGADGVSGTGSLATIDFAMVGSQSDVLLTSMLTRYPRHGRTPVWRSE